VLVDGPVHVPPDAGHSDRHCCIERSRMVRAADPINLRRTSQRPEQGKWGHERDASPCGRVQNHLAMAQCNSACRPPSTRQRTTRRPGRRRPCLVVRREGCTRPRGLRLGAPARRSPPSPVHPRIAQ
jgi:hypothetical protein